eukprot:m.45890 g.45890  ORF g.45890 m.45890 type:complete len:152 (+) comp15147_c0_seq1:163-618(+)
MQLLVFTAFLGMATAVALPPRSHVDTVLAQALNNTLGATYGGTFSLFPDTTGTCRSSPALSVKVSGDCTETYSAFQGDYGGIAIFPNTGACGTASSCAAFCGGTTSNDCKTSLAAVLSGKQADPASCAIAAVSQCTPLPISPGLYYTITSS